MYFREGITVVLILWVVIQALQIGHAIVLFKQRRLLSAHRQYATTMLTMPLCGLTLLAFVYFEALLLSALLLGARVEHYFSHLRSLIGVARPVLMIVYLVGAASLLLVPFVPWRPARPFPKLAERGGHFRMLTAYSSGFASFFVAFFG